MPWQEIIGAESLLVVNGRVFAGVSPVADGWWRWVVQIPVDHPARHAASFRRSGWWGISASPQAAKVAAENYLREIGVKENGK